MSNITIALAGNPNCGKTTLFNALTGANQYVGNWPGVTVEKKEGRLKGHKNIIIEDLPGIYSLSPYTLEEVVSRNYLVTDHPSLILNLVDGSNLERNLYLTTQLCELGVPVIIALNMMDIVRKRGDRIDTEKLSRNLGCQVLEISALKGTGIRELIDAVVTTTASDDARTPQAVHFPDHLEKAIGEIGEIITRKSRTSSRSIPRNNPASTGLLKPWNGKWMTTVNPLSPMNAIIPFPASSKTPSLKPAPAA
jgi:ferrous iron transport protein B